MADEQVTRSFSEGLTTNPNPDISAAQPDWREPYKADPVMGPIVSKLTEPDIPTALRSYSELKAHMGKAVFVKNGDPAELKAAQKRAYEMGLFPSPPKTAQEYEINRPKDHPAWSDELETEYRNWAHKHGLSNDAVKEGLAINQKQFSTAVAELEIDNKEAMDGLTAWAAEIKKDPAELMSMADDFITEVAAGDEQLKKFIETTGMLPIKHPSTMKLLGTAGLYAKQDSGDISGGQPPVDVRSSGAAEAEYNSILRDESNPKFKLYWSGDKPTVQYVEALAKKAHPGSRDL